LEPTADPAWVLREHGYDLMRETGVESRFAVSNGFLGVRGARAISRGPTWVSWLNMFNWTSWPRTYVAGLFDTPNAEPVVPALVPAADWLRVRILLDDVPLLLRSGDLLSHFRNLDLKRGLLISGWHHRSPAGVVVRLRTLRLVSLAERALGLQLIQLAIEEGQAEVTLEASFDTAGTGLDLVKLERDCGVWRTEQSGKGLAMAGAAALRLDGQDLAPVELGHLKWSWRWPSVAGQVASFDRLVAVARGDHPGDDPGHVARDALAGATRIGWRGVLDAHEAAWAERWRCSDIEVEGDAEAQQALRFASYHLNSAANPADERVSIGARALTGESYLGHVFWDTEIYLLPFYIVTWPEAARSLLMYRHRTLGGARHKAARMGWRGALYAWESADTGEETTPERVHGPDGKIVDVLCGTQEQHISADVAYAVWQYWQATHDEGFMLEAGAEIILETARFWASRAEGPDAVGHRHIRGIIGPDEFHEHVDDNAYTNVMAGWNIRRGLDVVAWLRERHPDRWAALSGQLALDDAELAQWREADESLVTGFDAHSGLFEQFAGYYALEPIDLAEYAGRTVAMDVVLGRERTRRCQVIKQADVVALLALLPDDLDRWAREANFRFYEPRCSHDSSLSRAMHGLVAARLGDVEMALRHFRRTAAIDLADTNGGSAGGVHIAALGGLWQVAVFGFAGLSLLDRGLSFDPHLPAGWRSMRFRVQWRGRALRVRVVADGGVVEATLERGEALTVLVRGEPYEVGPERPLRVGVVTG
jgi:trehalose/maltose hydrolase-like predicted phosphorylase